MPVFSLDWRGDVIANAKSPLSVRTAGGCSTQTSDYSYLDCYIMRCGSAETLKVSLCPPNLCGKSLWKILWHRERCVFWQSDDKLHNNIRMLKNVSACLRYWRQQNVVFMRFLCVFSSLEVLTLWGVATTNVTKHSSAFLLWESTCLTFSSPGLANKMWCLETRTFISLKCCKKLR